MEQELRAEFESEKLTLESVKPLVEVWSACCDMTEVTSVVDPKFYEQLAELEKCIVVEAKNSWSEKTQVTFCRESRAITIADEDYGIELLK